MAYSIIFTAEGLEGEDYGVLVERGEVEKLAALLEKEKILKLKGVPLENQPYTFDNPLLKLNYEDRAFILSYDGEIFMVTEILHGNPEAFGASTDIAKILENGTDKQVIKILDEYSLPLYLYREIVKRKDLNQSTRELAKRNLAEIVEENKMRDEYMD
jgi:hypothetical protein